MSQNSKIVLIYHRYKLFDLMQLDIVTVHVMYSAVNTKLTMAIKKRLSDNHIMEILFSEDSEGDLIPKSDPSE